MHAALPPWEYQDLEAWLRLALTPGVGDTSARRLLAQFGDPAAVFTASMHELQEHVSLAQAAQLRRRPEALDQAVQTTWAWLQQSHHLFTQALITLGDPRYPDSLLHTADPPLMLYALGPHHWLERSAPLLDWQHSLAIVGSRNPTPQGAEHAHQFAQHLAQQGWCIVSGMALGIDAAAHAGALAVPHAIHPTVAVVGTGIDRVYPRRHQALAHQLAQHGLVISEFPLGTPPIASNFPKRNRIISGLSRGTLVVEAALASGSLITARTATEQGREVFAIPGSIHNPLARGCHALIRQGAKLVERAEDILEEFSGHLPVPSSPPVATPEAQAPASALLEALGHDPVSLDSLTARTGYSTAELQAQLLELELDGWVQRLPGGLFQRSHRA